jgi:hypothetical protein
LKASRDSAPKVSSSTPSEGQLQQGETGVAPGQPLLVVEQAGPARDRESLREKRQEEKRRSEFRESERIKNRKINKIRNTFVNIATPHEA